MKALDLKATLDETHTRGWDRGFLAGLMIGGVWTALVFVLFRWFW